MPRKIFLTGFLICGFTALFAQNRQHLFNDKYVRDISDNINLGTRLFFPLNGIDFNVGNNKFLFTTNETFRLGFSFSHKWIILNILLPQIGSIPSKGNTRGIALNAYSYGRLFNITFNFANTRGYFLGNSESFKTWKNNSIPYMLLPDLRILVIGGTFTYIFNNKKFSIASIENHNALQLKSAGSPLVGIDYSHYSLSTDAGLIPSSFYEYVDPKSRLQRLDFHEISLNLGYSYTLKFWKRYFANATFFLSPNYRISNYDLVSDKGIEKSGFGFFTNSKTSIGYMGDKYYWGISGRVRLAQNIQIADNSSLNFSIGGVFIYWGIRFNVPKKLMRISEKIEYYRPNKHIKEFLKTGN